MSNSNENLQPQQSRDFVNIDETGKVVINSPELAKMTDELSLEELEAVSGGNPTNSCPTINTAAGCGVKQAEK